MFRKTMSSKLYIFSPRTLLIYFYLIKTLHHQHHHSGKWHHNTLYHHQHTILQICPSEIRSSNSWPENYRFESMKGAEKNPLKYFEFQITIIQILPGKSHCSNFWCQRTHYQGFQKWNVQMENYLDILKKENIDVHKHQVRRRHFHHEKEKYLKGKRNEKIMRSGQHQQCVCVQTAVTPVVSNS